MAHVQVDPVGVSITRCPKPSAPFYWCIGVFQQVFIFPELRPFEHKPETHTQRI